MNHPPQRSRPYRSRSSHRSENPHGVEKMDRRQGLTNQPESIQNNRARLEKRPEMQTAVRPEGALWRNNRGMPNKMPPERDTRIRLENADEATTIEKPKKFTSRCRLFVGNLPTDVKEDEFRELFAKFGEIGEVFINASRGFGFVKLDTRSNAEAAKFELDGFSFKNRVLRVKFASQGSSVKVKNFSPLVSNELLEEAFSMFGRVERAVVIVDERGRSIGEGIVEFERKNAAMNCINSCAEGCFFLTSDLKPVIVAPLEQRDEDEGLPERLIPKNNAYYREREQPPRFAEPGSVEYEIGLKWKGLIEQRRQLEEEVNNRIRAATEQIEFEIEQTLIDYQTQMLREDLIRRENDLKRMEEYRKNELEKRKAFAMKRQDIADNFDFGPTFDQPPRSQHVPPDRRMDDRVNFPQAEKSSIPVPPDRLMKNSDRFMDNRVPDRTAASMPFPTDGNFVRPHENRSFDGMANSGVVPPDPVVHGQPPRGVGRGYPNL